MVCRCPSPVRDPSNSLFVTAHLSQDVATSEAPSSAIDSAPLNGWYALQNLLSSLDVLFSTISQVLLLINLTIYPMTASTGSFPSGVVGASLSGVASNGTAANTGLGSAPTRNLAVANSIIVFVLCLAWPIINRVLKRDLDGMCMCPPSP